MVACVAIAGLLLAPGPMAWSQPAPLPPAPTATGDEFPEPAQPGTQPPDPVWGPPPLTPQAAPPPVDSNRDPRYLPPLPPPDQAGHATDYGQGTADGAADAETETNAALWFGAGCLLNIVGVLIAYVVEPSPPTARLVGRSPEYAMAFAASYRSTGSSAQGRAALMGCLTLVAVEGAVLLLSGL